ncbi:MAG TPA: hypothetical protein VGF98_13685 [Candidatus Tumulicola sp.]|jgi:hypothetical protein
MDLKSAAAAALIAALPVAAAAAPKHVLTFLYYHQSFGATRVNDKLSPQYMAQHADFIETSGFDNAGVNAFKAAGGRYGVTYIDPTFVPYCVPPFTAPAGACAGQIGNLNPAESAWFHDANNARINRADSYTKQYQEFLNPGSPAARKAIVAWMNGYLQKSPRLDFFFSDDSGSIFVGPKGTTMSGAFYGFNAAGVEIRDDKAWIAAENAMLSAAPRKLIINGGDLFRPAYNGAFLKNPNVAGSNHEGCFNAAYYGGRVNDSRGLWQQQADGLLADRPFGKFSLCMMNGAPTPDSRIYALASWWLTYDPRYSVAAPIAPDAAGNTIFPEFDIVPLQPSSSAGAHVRDLARGATYVREFANCYQWGASIGACATIVNPTQSAQPLPKLKRRYARVLVLDSNGSATGGRAYWRTGATGTLGPVSALILSEGSVRKSSVR